MSISEMLRTVPRALGRSADKAPLFYFPRAGEDELVHSMASRWAQNMGSPCSAVVLRRLYGDCPKHTSPLLTGNLEHLVAVQPFQVTTAEQLASKHTLLPYFTSCMTQDNADHLRRILSMGWERHASAWFGAMRAAAPSLPYLAFCPECVIEDLCLVGQPTWRRAHQLPGVQLCHIHGCRLRLSAAESGHTRSFETCPSNPEDYPQVKSILPNCLALPFARESSRLLQGDVVFSDHARLHAGMATLIAERGLVNNGRIERNRLEEQTREQVGAAAFSTFGMDAKSGRSSKRLHMCHEPRAQGFAPQWRYILILTVLKFTVDDLVVATENPRQLRAAAPRQKQRKAPSEAAIAAARTRISLAFAENPDWGRQQIFLHRRNAWETINAGDRAWWKANGPDRRNRGSRISWEERDTETASLIRAAVERLRAKLPPRVKLKKLRIIHEACLPRGFRADEKRLPQTAAILQAAVAPPAPKLRAPYL